LAYLQRNYKKPIIAVTALAVSGDKEKMLMHGFDDYISKPIDMNELERTLQKYI
jgi:CheY-like chemotaxis protein